MDDEEVIEKCIICLEGFTEENPKIKVGEKGIQTLLNFSKIRKIETVEQSLKANIEKIAAVLVHKNCRRDFTYIKRSLRITETTQDDRTPTSTKWLRSSIEPFNWKGQCFLCGKDTVQDKKNPTRKSFHQVTFIEFHKNIIEQYRKRNDSWGDQVYTRLSWLQMRVDIIKGACKDL